MVLLRAITRLALLLGASCAFQVARADSLAVPALHWVRAQNASQCIDPSTLAERVEQLTSVQLSRPAGAERMIEGQIERVAAGSYRARVTASSRGQAASGERVLEQEVTDCRGLDGALVFIVAMMVDPSLSLAGLPPELLALVSGEVPAEQKLLRDLEQNTPQPHVVTAGAAPTVKLPDEPGMPPSAA